MLLILTVNALQEISCGSAQHRNSRNASKPSLDCESKLLQHGPTPVQQIDSVLIKENMNNMKRLIFGKGVVSQNRADVPLPLSCG